MSTNPVCSEAIHAALVADDLAWSRMPYVGVQLLVPGAHLEMRECVCGQTMSRAPLGEVAAICARYDRACADSDIGAKYTSRRAMSGDQHEVQVWRDMVAMERLIGGEP